MTVRAALVVAGLSDTGNENTRQTSRFMTANSITDVEDFASLDVDQVREICKTIPKGTRSGHHRHHSTKQADRPNMVGT